jgi:hypothetical protein
MELFKKQPTYKQLVLKVKKIRDFYNHLQIFVGMIFVLFSDTVIDFFEIYISNENVLYWIKINIWIPALLWTLGLAIHGIVPFGCTSNFVDYLGKKKVKA